MLLCKLLSFQFLCLIQFSLKVGVSWLECAKFGQRSDRILKLLHQVLALAAEVEGFDMVRSHVHDLLGDGNDGLELLDLEFADAKVCKARELESLQLLRTLLKLISCLILSQEVVSDVAEVKVAVDFLVNFCCL